MTKEVCSWDIPPYRGSYFANVLLEGSSRSSFATESLGRIVEAHIQRMSKGVQQGGRLSPIHEIFVILLETIFVLQLKL